MNCRYTDEELKEDVERTIGIRAKDIETVSYTHLDVYKRQILRRSSSAACGTFDSGPLVRTSIIIVAIPMTRCIWLSRHGNGPKDRKEPAKSGPVSYTHLDVYKRQNQAGSFLSSAFLYCYKNRFIVI